MAVALRSVGQSPGANSTSCVIVKPVGLAVGDLMVAQVVAQVDGAITFTPPGGWTEIRVDHGALFYTGLFWKIAVAADVAATNFTFTFTDVGTESNRGAITAWTGHDPTTPINANNGQYNDPGSTTVTSPGITPSVANCMICLFCGIYDNNTQSGYAIATSNPASWSEAYDLPSDLTYDLGLSLGYALRPQTSATGNGTATTSGSDYSTGQLVAISPPVSVTYELTLTDGIGIGEALVKSISRILSDGIGIAEVWAGYKAKVLTLIDGIGIGDALQRTVSKVITDGIGIGEALIKTTAKVLSDGIAIGEALSKTISRVLTDGIAIGEALTKTISKVITDGVGVGEALIKTTQKVFSDGLGIGEALVKKVSKTFTDGIGIGEVLTRTFSKVFTDGIGIGENLWTVWVHGATRVMSYIRNLPAVRNLLRLR